MMRALLRSLGDLPTTALVTTTGCVLALLTALFFFGATIAGRPIDDGNWTAWLMFVAAMLGVGYAQFAKKRETYVPPYGPPYFPPDHSPPPSSMEGGGIRRGPFYLED